MPSKFTRYHKKSHNLNLNRFSSVWAPDLLRQSRLQRICLWTLWTVERFGRQLRESAQVTFRGLYHLRKCESFLESKPIHVKRISPQVHKQWWITSTCEDLWGYFSRKFIALSFGQVHLPKIDPGSKVPPVQIRSLEISWLLAQHFEHIWPQLLSGRAPGTPRVPKETRTCKHVKP